MDAYLKLFIIFGILTVIAAQCTLPLNNGTWYSSTRGNWVIPSDKSQIQNFKADLSRSLTTTNLECVSKDSNKYTLKTNFEIFFNVFIDVYTCLEFIEQSSNSYVYYVVTATDPSTSEEFTSDQASACTNSGYNNVLNRHVAVYATGASSAGETCPNAILGNYTVEYDTVDSIPVTGVYLSVCTDKTQLQFNKTGVAFTAGNTLTCIDYVTSGSYIYLHTYNNDLTIKNPTTYRFTCWVIANTDSPVQATAYPSKCVQGQTPTTTVYGGQVFTLNQLDGQFCGTVEPIPPTPFAGWKIALIVLGALAGLIAILGIVLSVRYCCARRREVSDEEMDIIKGERRASPDSLGEDDIAKEKARHKIDGYDSGFDENALRQKPLKEKEKTFDLLEIKRPGHKLQDSKPVEPEVASQPPLPPIEFPPGKKPIPPTTPRPEEEDLALLRIKKERERKEKERQERLKKKQEIMGEGKKVEEAPQEERTVDQVIKVVRESSSGEEYETDESEREQKLLEKRRRLKAAEYKPPDGVPDATVVGRKKRRKHREGDEAGELSATLTTREQQDHLARKRSNRKKALKKIARNKFRGSPSDADTTDSETDRDSGKRRHKRRKVGDPRGLTAPYIEQYHVKKGIEKELDDMDYWQDKFQPTVISDSDEEADKKEIIEPIQVAPADTAKAPGEGAPERSASRLEKILEEEADVWNALGVKGFSIGPTGELPDGFHFDEHGNVVRDIDGKIIPKETFEKQLDNRRKFGFVFSLPRLIRNTDGRPLGGYKDDEFGPTAEWDYGELPAKDVEEDVAKKTESQEPLSGKQVAFSVEDGLSASQSPLKEMDYSQMKGRQLGSAERDLLKHRLFDGKDIPDTDAQAGLPVYFKGTKGGVKPESVYIDNTQIERHGPPPIRKVNTAPSMKQNMIVRSDTFDDGRPAMMRRSSRLRSSWSGREADFIPEEGESQGGVQGLSRGKRNIGSDDEFILLGGSMKKLDAKAHGIPKTSETLDSHFASHWCSRYERQGFLPSRELPREMSDLESLGMRTATDTNRPASVDDRKMKKLLQELYTDKKYFDHYLDSEKLPTNAGSATRGLVSHGLDFLKTRAQYWDKHQPINPHPPPSELALRLSRMRTFNTNMDSGRETMLTSGRPFSAGDALESSRGASRENSILVPPLELNRSKTAEPPIRHPPTGRSEIAPTPSVIEQPKQEKTEKVEEIPRDKENIKPKPKTPELQKVPLQKSKKVSVSDEAALPGSNVLSLTETET